MTAKAPLGAFLRQNPYPAPYTQGLFYREKMRAIHRVAPDRAVADALEVGGGVSGLTGLLYPHANITNADIDPECADSPVNRRARTTFVHADATGLPFADDTFDAVTMFDVLEHVEDDMLAMTEALRVLRPSGFLLVTSPNEHWRFPYHAGLRFLCPNEEEMLSTWRHVRRGYSSVDLERMIGSPPTATETFITPLTSVVHDIGFSKLREPLRRWVCAVVAPIGWVGYTIHRPGGRGTETASRWEPAK